MDTEVQTIPGYRPVYNEVTERTDFLTSGVLETPLSATEQENSNGRKYKVANVRIALPSGVDKILSAMCYEGNYKHKDLEGKDLEVGKPYLTRINYDDKGVPHLQLSHLTNANRATAEDFAELLAMSGEKKEQKAPVEKGAPTA